MTEEWKPVEGFEGLYEISSLGRLKSYKVNPSGKILSTKNSKGDYISVVLQGIGKSRRSVRMHRLVAQAFLPNPKGLAVVNHIDGNKQNNAASNLEWCSQQYNVKESMRLHPGQNAPMKKYNADKAIPVAQYTKSGEFIRLFSNAKEAANTLGICERNIRQVASGAAHRKTAGGFIWRNGGDTKNG